MAIHLDITSNASKIVHSNKFSLELTIGQLKVRELTYILNFKDRLELITGCDANNMRLELFDKTDASICKPDDAFKTLNEYSFAAGTRLHVIDPSIQDNQLDDQNEDVYYKLTEDDYANRKDTIQKFLQANKLGKYKEVDPAEQKELEESKQRESERLQMHAKELIVGNRCEVHIQNAPSRRGFIRFVGTTKFKEGPWVGIQYDEPVGKNDGCVGGVKYFECKAKYGGFVRPDKVEMGDFPELGMDEIDEF
ncbi:hypothetical protein Ciccas_012828 [Cichlidogyrus casuarinus]|uniref:CAP-Gly domain-containing protein n=1 Tax=Cichlidogyrus casuarinus TaxID=1844966 RepID=A0ABD2PPM8_9PLAT